MYTVYFDFETGGVEMTHPNISLAAVTVDEKGVEIDKFYRLIQFDESTAQPEALRINHYEVERWKADARTEREVLLAFLVFVNRFKSLTLTSAKSGNPYQVARLAGYNSASFDGPRLQALCDKYGAFPPFRRPTLDVLQLFLDYSDRNGIRLTNNKLSTVAQYFKIPIDGAHDALEDCRMTAAIHFAMNRVPA